MNDVPPIATASSLDPPIAFATSLFGRTAREDLLRYEPRALATLAALAWRHLGEARPSGAGLRIFDPEADDSELAGISVIEVINDDMPFLLDSTLAELSARGLELRLVAHPILSVERDAEGRLVEFYPDAASAGPAARRESLIHIHVARLTDRALISEIMVALESIYADIRLAVTDWPAMRQSVIDAAADLAASASPLAVDETSEAVQLLGWLASNNFTFLGMRDFGLEQIAAEAFVPDRQDFGSPGLGILRDPSVRVLRDGAQFVRVVPEMRDFLQKPVALLIIKADALSYIHRRAPMDCIIIKQFARDGELRGETCLVGLFTSSAYNSSPQAIPYVRQKIARVLAAANFDPRSHSGKGLINILESFPRDELFQIDAETLTQMTLAIASLNDRPRLRVLARPDVFGRFVSILAFIPRDRYGTRVSNRIGDYLAKAFDGRITTADPYFPEGTLVRVHYIVSRAGGPTPRIEQAELENDIASIVRTWDDMLTDALREEYGSDGGRFEVRYTGAFSAAYREAYGAVTALADIALLERLTAADPLALVLYRPAGEPAQRLDIKLYSRGRPLPLSERVPVLEQMGFRVISEQTFEIRPGGEATPAAELVWLHDMALESASGEPVDLAARSKKLEAAFMALFLGAAEPDGFNGLVLAIGMDWRDVTLLRALSRYLRQIGITYSGGYIWNALLRNATIAQQLVALFYARFNPDQSGSIEERAAHEAGIGAEIDKALVEVASLDEDRILRRFRNLVTAAVRTNYFQRRADGERRAAIAIKFQSARIDDLPLPRPLFEISVYSPVVEAIHMRFGPIARGGIRWSDRAQDFRTEILGLAKAQQVKNAVIVPVGAKGGFVPKRLPPPSAREAWLAEGIATYELFIGSLLDLTDNIVGTEIVPPPRTVRHDGDDPYLVVAADKGTATFSDFANKLSLARDYWLGDAFASGGSAGYDHKKMGITARGAFVAVKRHFREMDIDIDEQPISAVGIGDMSGDVFGNGMLLTPQLRLLAAFDHRDIFIDPNPDSAVSHAERARLFALPRSSWQDYDRSRLSAGGGIYSRQMKEISLSAEARTLLGVSSGTVAPNELIQAILKAQVDLIWFGGIGTYVKSSSETDEAVADRANDAVRIAAASLNCRVIGEGANLGMTQLGRIEAAERGIRLDTDAIDNSAGVNTSDVEVNIKIALAPPIRQGKLDGAGRQGLLSEMTDEVAARVLRNVYDQTLALSLAVRRGAEDVPFAIRLMQWLERLGRLDRGVEFLASDAALNARARNGRGLTRPELAILLAYAKLAVEDELLRSGVPDDPFLSRELALYFPPEIVARFPEAVATHRLRREIIATTLANRLIDRGGPTIITRVADETGADIAAIVRAFALVREAFGLDELEAAIDTLDNKVAGAVQLALYAEVQNLVNSRLVWFIRNVDLGAGLASLAARFRDGVHGLFEIVATVLPVSNSTALAARAAELGKAGVPETLAERIAGLGALGSAPDIVVASEQAGRPLAFVAATYFAADDTFDLSALARAGRAVAVADYYDRLALDRAIDQIERAHRRITTEIIAAAPADISTGADAVTHWIAGRGSDAVRIRAAVADIVAVGLNVSRLIVAASLLDDLART